jgi:hypothetical protein
MMSLAGALGMPARSAHKPAGGRLRYANAERMRNPLAGGGFT